MVEPTTDAGRRLLAAMAEDVCCGCNLQAEVAGPILLIEAETLEAAAAKVAALPGEAHGLLIERADVMDILRPKP